LIEKEVFSFLNGFKIFIELLDYRKEVFVLEERRREDYLNFIEEII